MFTLSDEERAIVEVVGDFVDREVRPVVRELEHANTYPERLIERMKELGVFGLAVPEPYGEVSVSKSCYALVTEELARGWMSLAGAVGGHTVVSYLFAVFGTEEQKRRYLPRMATGELRATMALTEPSGGSDLQAMSTTARRAGDRYVVSGSKMWIRPASAAPSRRTARLTIAQATASCSRAAPNTVRHVASCGCSQRCGPSSRAWRARRRDRPR